MNDTIQVPKHVLASVVLAVAAFSMAYALTPTSANAAGYQQMCYDLYQPVCGAKHVECFAAPCYPVYTTYSNSCFMQEDDATFVHDGECTASDTGPLSATASSSTTVTSTTTVGVFPGIGHMGPGPVVLPGRPHIGGGPHASISPETATSATSVDNGTSSVTVEASSSAGASSTHHAFLGMLSRWWKSLIHIFS